jgi:hypothetical protein
VPSIREFFDRVVVVNLARRPERLAQFISRLQNWPFRYPVRQEAVDGRTVAVPDTWRDGPGAWGCQLSHRTVLDLAHQDRLNSVLILEDDAYPVVDIAQRAQRFVQSVPDDWDCLMLGAQHLSPPIPVCDGVVRCVASNRTHAFAVRGKFLRTLRNVWSLNKTDHCDLVLSSLMRVFKAYSPDPLLIGQDGGESDVTNRYERLRFLTPPQADQIASRDPRHAFEKLVVHVAKPAKSVPRVPV